VERKVTMKKKIAVATLAVSLSAASFAGLPLSEKGLAQKLGLSSFAYAANTVPSTSAEFKAKLTEIDSKITELGLSVTNARNAVAGLPDSNVDDLMTKLTLAGTTGYESITAANVSGLFKSLILISLAKPDTVDAIKQPIPRETINQLGKLAGLTLVTGSTYLTYDDFIAFASAVETNVRSGINLTTLFTANGYKTLLKSAISDVLAADNTKFAQAFNDLGITEDDLYDTLGAYTDSITGFDDAVKAVVIANASIEAALVESTSGSTIAVSLKIANFPLSADYLNWSVTGGSGLVSVVNNKLQFSTFGSDTFTLKASLNLPGSSYDNQLIYSNEITRSYSPSVNPNPNPGTGGPETPSNPTVADISKELDKAADEIKNATPEQKAKILDDLLAKSQKALDEAAKLDVSKALTTDGDKSTTTLDTAAVKKLLEDIQKSAKELNDKLTALGAEEQLKLTLNIDLGTVATSTGEVKINKDILKAAQDLGFANAAVVVNGVSVSLPVASFSEDVALGVTTNKNANLGSTTSNTQVSDVIDFNLSVGGQAVTSFEQPIEVRIALRNVAGVDKDLLSIARITDGQVEYYGGKVVGNEFVELRDRFSSYAIVENKVEFNDVAKVQSWAGRQIQVVAAKGAVEGKAKGKFAPSDLITRAEFAKMLTRALDLDNVLAKSTFGDVKDGHWSAAYIAAAADLGIIQGRSATTFAPTATITRAEMATMIARALKVTNNLKDVENVDAIVGKFSDAADIPNSLKAGVAFAADNSIVIGNAGKFSPNANATRAEAAVILYRAINFTK